MKKTLVLAVVLAGFFICASGAQAVQLGFWGVQHRVYEDGTVFSRAFFSMMEDSGASLTEDIVASVELYGPDDGKIESIERTFWQCPMPIEGSYDADKGQWSYDTQGFLAGEKDYYYTLTFATPVVAGTYRLKVVDTDGNTYEQANDYAGPVELPAISAKSFSTRLDQNGNFIMTWDAPTTVDPEVNSSIRVEFYRNDQQEGYTPPQINPEIDDMTAVEIYVQVPTHLGMLLVPKDVMDVFIDAQGDYFYTVGLQIREASSRTRYYTNTLTLGSNFSLGSPYPVLSTTDLSLTLPKVEFAGSFYELNLTCTDPVTLTWQYKTHSPY